MIEHTCVGKRKEKMSDREITILMMKYCNFTSEEVGQLLGISKFTVNSTVSKLSRKFDIKRIWRSISFMEEQKLHDMALKLKSGWEKELEFIKEKLKSKGKKK